MKLNGKDVRVRKCSFCGEIVEKINYNIECWEYGHILRKEVLDPSHLDAVPEGTSWKEDSCCDEFRCEHCNFELTSSITEAKEFLMLPEDEEDENYEPEYDYEVDVLYITEERLKDESKAFLIEKIIDMISDGVLPYNKEDTLSYYLTRLGIDNICSDEIKPISKIAKKLLSLYEKGEEEDEESYQGYCLEWKARVI